MNPVTTYFTSIYNILLLDQFIYCWALYFDHVFQALAYYPTRVMSPVFMTSNVSFCYARIISTLIEINTGCDRLFIGKYIGVEIELPFILYFLMVQYYRNFISVIHNHMMLITRHSLMQIHLQASKIWKYELKFKTGRPGKN